MENVAPKCSAKTRASVHLRPKAQETSAGPVLTAGSELVVLARSSISRKGLPLYKVAAKSSGLVGYVFLGDRELGKECPLLWPQPSDEKPNRPADTKLDDGREQCFRAGTFPKIKQLYDPSCATDHGKPKPASYKLDVNGDGRVDELLDYANQLVLALNTERGYTPLLLARGIESEHHDGAAEWREPVRAGGVVYLVSTYSESTLFDDMDQPEYVSAFTLYRVRADGAVFEVYGDTVEKEDVTREFRGNADGSVLVSDGKGRSHTLHWNDALYRFVP